MVLFKMSDIQILIRMTNELKCSHLQVYNLWPDSITFFTKDFTENHVQIKPEHRETNLRNHFITDFNYLFFI